MPVRMPHADENCNPLSGAAMYSKFCTSRDQQSPNHYEASSMSHGAVSNSYDSYQRSTFPSRSPKKEKITLTSFESDATNVNLQIQARSQNSVPAAAEMSKFVMPTTNRHSLDLTLTSQTNQAKQASLRESQVECSKIVQNNQFPLDLRKNGRSEEIESEIPSTSTETGNDLTIGVKIKVDTINLENSQTLSELQNLVPESKLTIEESQLLDSCPVIKKPTDVKNENSRGTKSYLPGALSASSCWDSSAHELPPAPPSKRDGSESALYKLSRFVEQSLLPEIQVQYPLPAPQTEDKNCRKRKLRPYPCSVPDCGKDFQSRALLEIHLRRHTSDKPFQCPWNFCGKSFVSKSDLKKHTNSHGKLTECPCLNCSVEGGNKTRDSKNNLIHKCHYRDCEKVYNSFWHFEKHLVWHTSK